MNVHEKATVRIGEETLQRIREKAEVPAEKQSLGFLFDPELSAQADVSAAAIAKEAAAAVVDVDVEHAD